MNMKRKHEQITAEAGIGTLEVVVIIAVLLAVALLFRTQIMEFATSLISRVFNFSILDGL